MEKVDGRKTRPNHPKQQKSVVLFLSQIEEIEKIRQREMPTVPTGFSAIVRKFIEEGLERRRRRSAEAT